MAGRTEEVGPLKVAVVSLATALLGVVLIALGATVWSKSWLGKVADSVASVLLASMLVAWLADYLLRRDFLRDVESAASAALQGQITSLRQIEGLGVLDVTPEFPLEQAREEIANAKKSVRILHTWVGNFEAFEGAISSAAASGAFVRVLLLSPLSPAAKLRSLDQGYAEEDSVSEHIRANLRQLLRFTALTGPNVEIRLYSGLPSVQIYSGDHAAFIGMYWHGKSSLRGTTIRVRLESSFGDELLSEFEHRWASASPGMSASLAGADSLAHERASDRKEHEAPAHEQSS